MFVQNLPYRLMSWSYRNRFEVFNLDCVGNSPSQGGRDLRYGFKFSVKVRQPSKDGRGDSPRFQGVVSERPSRVTSARGSAGELRLTGRPRTRRSHLAVPLFHLGGYPSDRRLPTSGPLHYQFTISRFLARANVRQAARVFRRRGWIFAPKP